MKEMGLLDDYPSVDSLTNQPIDPLESFYYDELRALPETTNKLVHFYPSEDIAEALRGKNYGKVHYFKGESSLKLVNKSKSVGQKAYVKIVSFRSVERE